MAIDLRLVPLTSALGICLAHHRSDSHGAILGCDGAELFDAPQVDEPAESTEPKRKDRDEALTPGKDLRVLGTEDPDGIGQGRGRLVGKRCWFHVAPHS